MEKTKRVQWLCGSKTYSPQKLIAAGDTLIPHSSLPIPHIPHYKKFSLTSKEKYAIIKENGMSVKFYDGSNFDENNGYYRLC